MEQQAKNYDIKVPKGTRDHEPADMFIREETFATITKCFKRHGAVPIDTPVFELKDVLTDKYGEDSKLIFELADQGEGEKLALRYDLTVPFARYVATHGLKNMKRYHIGKVYRRDEPYMTRGRYREFYQCDYDIAGTYDPMLPDADCLKLVCETLTELKVGEFSVRLSHRKILDGIFEVCEVPENLYRTISSAVDKLDKKTFAEVKEEMIQKGVTASVADKIGTYVKLAGSPLEVLAKLKEDSIMSNKSAAMGVNDLQLLFSYLGDMKCLRFISFDLSLARGLDYYTGVIFEAIHLSKDAEGIGSILGGGRYDDLVGKFSSQKVPSVGFSVGVERILAEKKKRLLVQQVSPTRVFVAAVHVPVGERLKVCCELWDADIATEFTYENDPRIAKQYEKANNLNIPWVITIGEDELAKNIISIKNMVTGQQEVVKRKELGFAMKSLLRRENKN